MSSQLMLGTSTTVSLREEGLELPRACLKWSWVTAMASRISASMVSSSISIRSIFSLMHCIAASVQRAAISAPTKPWVSAAMTSGSTSSSSFMLRVWMRKTSRRPFSSGTPMSISLSKRPKRRRAGSMELGLLVAPITTTEARPFMPSIRVSIWETILLSTSPLVLSLLGAMESISSMKMMEGAFFSASSKAFLRLLSLSPAILDMISGPLMRKKKAPVSLATARAMRVFPDPGGPYRSTPRGGLTPRVLKRVG
mmetsp:Transcript_13821/g.28273  ORF Transcript_13821/g.28273 Transcript_13821/m.28273 type:complete len:254 (+) Transcript_13821:1090-1851(+)